VTTMMSLGAKRDLSQKLIRYSVIVNWFQKWIGRNVLKFAG